MDYEALAYAKLHDYQRERAQHHLAAHARQLHPRQRIGLAARADRLLIRLGHGASKRQARRAASGGPGDLPMRNAYR